MKVIVTGGYEDSCRAAADMIVAQVRTDPASKLGLATGGTAEGVYAALVSAYRRGEVSFSGVSTVNLDEYRGLAPDDPQSYHSYMNRLFFDLVDIDRAHTYVPSGTRDADEEIALFREKLTKGRPIDIQLLGIGVSGHIGFNEPGAYLASGVHIERLHKSTVESNARFFEKPEDVPVTAITMGVGDIMKARSIVLVAAGKAKAAAMRSLLMDGKITTQVPATVLKMHPDVTVVIDRELADEIGFTG